jgi:hypothetical protein
VQADAAPLLPQVDDDAAAGLLDDGHGLHELQATVAAQRVEDVAGEALGVHAHQDRPVTGDVAHDQGQVDAVVNRGLIGDRRELAELGGQPGVGDAPHELLAVRAVLDEVLDGDHLEAEAAGQVVELGQPGHATLLVEHLADDAGRIAAGQAGEIDGSLGVAGTP